MGKLDHVRLHLVETLAEANELNEWVLHGPMQHGKMAVDTEGTGLSPERDHVRMVQLGDMNEGWAIPWERWSGLYADVMARYQGQITMQNAPFDTAFLDKMGVPPDRSRIRDVRPMAHLNEPHMPTGLKSQAERHIDRTSRDAQKDLDDAIKRLGWGGVPVTFGPYWQYAALDTVLTAHLEDFHSQSVPWHGYEVENSVQFVLEQMMRRGIAVDLDYARAKSQEFQSYCARAREWVLSEYGIAIGSNLKIIEILQSQGYEFDKLTTSGALALDKEVLGGIDHPLAQTVLRHRQISKLDSTYLNHYLTQHINGVIHPSINSLGARTGRKSVSDPNFQNLPRVSEHNRAASVVRNCVVSRPGHTLLFCDKDQIEMRVLAHLSQDPALIAAFHSPTDFFVSLAQMVFQDQTIVYKKDPRRQLVKSVGYGEIYGAGVDKLAQTAGVPFAMASEAKNRWNESFPGVASFKAAVMTEAMNNKRVHGESFVVCPLSGRRHVADRGKEYALVNYLVQGMAAFLFKTKILELDAAGLGPYMILPVHDEIILDVPDDKVAWAVQILVQVMNDATLLSVPISSGVAYGKRWGEKKEYTNE